MAGGIDRDQLPERYLTWPHQIRCFGVDGEYNPVEQKAGPEVGLAEVLVHRFPNEEIIIVKHAIGGSNLANEWSPTGDIRQKDEPLQRRHCYADLQQAIAHAEAASSLQYIGFAWMQGERDSREPGMTANYYQYLKELIAAVRTMTQTPHLRIAIGRITPRCLTEDGRQFQHTYRNQVRAAQELFCENDAASFLVDTDDLPQRQDALHFNTAGCLRLGRRFAEVLVDTAMS